MAGGDRSDDAIEQDIARAPHVGLEIEGAVISVNVTKGIVILEGTVRGYQRAAAERISKETLGVTAVDNRLRLIDPASSRRNHRQAGQRRTRGGSNDSR